MRSKGILCGLDQSRPASHTSTKAESLSEQLQQMVSQMQPGQRLPSVRELQKLWGVSLSTVNAVLDELESKRIVDRRPRSGIFVSDQAHRRKVAIITDPNYMFDPGGSAFWGLLTRGLWAELSRRQMEVSFHVVHVNLDAAPGTVDNRRLQASFVEELRERRVDGVISIGVDHPTVHWIEAQGIPVAAFAGPAMYWVGIDYRGMARTGLKAIQQKGRRRVAALYGWAEHRRLASLPRRYGLESVAELYDVPKPSYTCSDTEFAYEAAKEWFSRAKEQRPDAILSLHDMATLGVLMAMRELKIEPGCDVTVATHVNVGSPVLLGWHRQLIRLEFDPIDVCRKLGAALEAAMDGIVPRSEGWLAAKPIRAGEPEMGIRAPISLAED